MSVPGFQDPAVASLAPAGNLYYAADASQAVKIPGAEVLAGGGTSGQSVDNNGAPSLMFGGPEKFTGGGEAIVTAASQATTGGRGSAKEILNFHGSPAPWILIGILLVAGILHLSAEGKFGAGV
jgi:hypothetical protein